ncbi:DNA-binding transcriptional regulator, GntR family [Rhodococcus pyridinivorans]|uniref:GntR family transcriptional regulator n=1 Tax=Rhodococcus pyridinivorans TaxID=103816 RepID=UPI00089925E9|nr:GntR family transcriptional regulator [Rhodococcus pyridinivorans]SEE11354.1 DNA-binding transcriptional regulator, GntR family [Rhodococcus pyridinivorans]
MTQVDRAGSIPTKSMPRRKSSDRQAADWLRDAIVDGGYTPGARLTENALAEGTELSRSTMRTALLHLASEGLVVREAYSGWRVAELSAADARDVYNLRSALDGLAARHAALNVTDDGVVALKAALLDLVLAARERTDVRRLADMDMAFHCQVVRMSGNARLEGEYDRLKSVVLRYVRATNLMASSETIISEHAAIFDAIAAGDPDLAEQLAIRHVLDHGEQLAQELARAPETEL